VPEDTFMGMLSTVVADGADARPLVISVPSVGQREAIAAAFALGWRLAELYDHDSLPSPRRPADGPDLPDHLPGVGQMSDHEQAVVILEQAGGALAALEAELGTELPGLSGVRSALNLAGHHRDDVRRAVLAAYLEIRDPLLGTAPLAAISYGLGRLLADTVYLPRSLQPETFASQFDDYRLATGCSWLDDLSAAFPHRAAAAVRTSLQQWQAWFSAQKDADGRLDPNAFGEPVLRALHCQGEMWRRLLTGEKDPVQLLGSTDYVAAGEQLLQRGRQIARHFLWHWWPVITVFIALTAAAIWAAVTYAPAGSSRVAAVLVSATAAIGLSWKGVGATLGKALDKAETALWDSEVDAATARAATLLPPRPKGRRPL
jgi:hypothetical protein